MNKQKILTALSILTNNKTAERYEDIFGGLSKKELADQIRMIRKDLGKDIKSNEKRQNFYGKVPLVGKKLKAWSKKGKEYSELKELQQKKKWSKEDLWRASGL